MHSGFDDLTRIAIVVLAALLGGIGLSRLRQPPILGYILAGIILGPSGVGFVQDRENVELLAELGVLLLLFIIGMELSLRTFKRYWIITTSFTILLILTCVAITYGLSLIIGWSLGLFLLLGFAIALSSTAIVVKMLEGIDETSTETGQITIGILIAQDLALVPMIIILNNMDSGNWFDLALVIKLTVAIGLMAILINYFSRRQQVRIRILQQIAKEKDLIPLISLAFCFAAAALSGLIGLSAAYGAFIAGLILGNTHEHRTLFETTQPVQSVLLMVFFLSIGLLLDFDFVLQNFGTVISLLLLITLGKTSLNILLLRLLRMDWPKAFLIGVLLAQIGEFAFLLTTIAVDVKIINNFGQKLVVSLAVLSLIFSPIWMATARKICEISDPQTRLQDIIKSLYTRDNKLLRRLRKIGSKKK